MKEKNKIISLLLSTVLFFAPFMTFAEDGGLKANANVSVGVKMDDEDNDDDSVKEKDNNNDRDHENGEDRGWGIKKGFLEWRTEVNSKKDELKTARDDFKNASKEEKDSLKARLGMALFGRFDVVATGLQDIHDRIKARLDAETTVSSSARVSAQSELDLAQTDINSLKVKATAIKTIFDTKVTTEAERKAKQDELKKDITDAKALVKSAHEHLKNSFKTIKLDLNANASAQTGNN